MAKREIESKPPKRGLKIRHRRAADFELKAKGRYTNEPKNKQKASSIRVSPFCGFDGREF